MAAEGGLGRCEEGGRGSIASALCATPMGRSDEGGRASCRVLCDYVSRPYGMGDGVRTLLDNRVESALKNGKSVLKNVPSRFT